MGTRSLSALPVVIVFMLALFALPSLADDALVFQILQPLPNYNVVNGKVPIAVTFTNPADAQITRFESFLDGDRLVWGRIRYPDGQPSTVFSFRTDADLSEMTPPPSAGLHVLVIKLYDSQGRMSQNQVTINVPGTTGAGTFSGKGPQVRILNPSDNGVVTGKTDIQVDAVSDAGIKFVIVSIDGKVYGVTTEPPYTIPWDPVARGFTAGKYTIVASAIDMFDNKGTSTPITITFDPSDYTTIGGTLIPLSPMSPMRPPQVTDSGRMQTSGSVLPPATWGGDDVRSIGLLLPLSPRVEGSLAGAQQIAMLMPVKNGPGILDIPMTDVTGSMSPARTPTLNDASVMPPASSLGLLPSTPSSVILPSLGALPTRGEGDVRPALLALALPSIHLMNGTYMAPDVPEPVISSITTSTTPSDLGISRTQTAVPATLQPIIRTPNDLVEPSLSVGRIESSVTPRVTTSALPAWQPSASPLTPEAVPNGAPVTSGAIIVTNPGSVGAPLRGAQPSVQSPEMVASATVLSQIAVADQHADTAPVAALSPLPPIGGKLTPGTVPQPIEISAAPQSVATGLQPPSQGATPIATFEVGSTFTAGTPHEAGTPPMTGTVEIASLPPSAPTVITADQLQIRTPATGMQEPSPQLTFVSEATVGKPVTSVGLSPISPGSEASPDVVPVTPGSPELGVDALTTHAAQPGETLQKIALAHGITPDDLGKLNPGLSPDRLPVGSKVIVPVPGVHFYLNGTPIVGRDGLYPDPYIVNDTSMVPIRLLIEGNGGTVDWLPNTQEVNAWSDGTFIGVKIGDTTAHINSETVTLAQPATLVADRTMVPVRFLMTALNLDLEYNPSSGTYSLINRESK